MASIEIKRGQIWQVALDPIIGREQGKTRPCLVVQRDSANATSPVTIVCPVTDRADRPPNLLNVAVQKGEAGLKKASLVLCTQIRTIDRRRLRGGTPLGTVAAQTLALVDTGLRAILDL